VPSKRRAAADQRRIRELGTKLLRLIAVCRRIVAMPFKSLK
jgi:hypothetical protein